MPPDSDPDLYASLPVDRRMDSRLAVPPCFVARYPQEYLALTRATENMPYDTSHLERLHPVSLRHDMAWRVNLWLGRSTFVHRPEIRPLAQEPAIMLYWLAVVGELIIYQHELAGDCDDCPGSLTKPCVMVPTRVTTLVARLHGLMPMFDVHSPYKRTIALGGGFPAGPLGLTTVILKVWWLLCHLNEEAHLRFAPETGYVQLMCDIMCGMQEVMQSPECHLLRRLFEWTLIVVAEVRVHAINTWIATQHPSLIHRTTHDQRKCLSRSFATGSVDLSGSRTWYDAAQSSHCHDCELMTPSSSEDGFDVLLHAIVTLCDNPDVELPVTLNHYSDAIFELQTCFQDIVDLFLCVRVLKKHLVHVTEAERDCFRSSIIRLTDEHEGLSRRVVDHLDSVAELMERMVLSGRGRRGLSAEQTVEDPSLSVINELHAAFHGDERARVVAQFSSKLEELAREYAYVLLRQSTSDIRRIREQWRAEQAHAEDTLLPNWRDMARNLSQLAVLNWQTYGRVCYTHQTVAGSFE